MSTARCYTCHTLRPIHAFQYRRKDNFVSATDKLKRYLAVFLNRPGASRRGKLVSKPGGSGVVFRYRCIHPLDGACPTISADENGHSRRGGVRGGAVERVVQVQAPVDGTVSRDAEGEGDLRIEVVPEIGIARGLSRKDLRVGKEAMGERGREEEERVKREAVLVEADRADQTQVSA